MAFSSLTLTAIQQEGSSSTGMGFKFPVHIIPSTLFKLLKQRIKDSKMEIK